MTQPQHARLVVVKILTSELRLYGVGCASFWFRNHAVYAAIEKHLKPFLLGRDVSPVGHAANVHLDLTIRNFGIQESVTFSEATQEVFPGTPVIKDGFLHVNEAPGLGVDINEEAAAKHPFPEKSANWKPVRRRDGTSIRP